MAAFANMQGLAGDPAELLDLDGPGAAEAAPVAEEPVNWNVFKMQYHGTWPHTEDPNKKSPEDTTKQEFGELVLRLADKVFRRTSDSRRARLNKVAQCAVFMEPHASGKPHFHFPILADRPWSSEPLKKELRAEGIFVDFSTDHDYYWTTFIYLCVPGTNPGDKKAEEIDSDPWRSPGHPTVRETLGNIPRGARACDKARVRRFLSLDSSANAGSNKDIALTDKDFAKQVVDKNLLDVTAVQGFVAAMCEAVERDAGGVPQHDRLVAIGMEAYMYKNQAISLIVSAPCVPNRPPILNNPPNPFMNSMFQTRSHKTPPTQTKHEPETRKHEHTLTEADLSRRVAFAWEVARAPSMIALRAKTAWDMILHACRDSPCVCGGQWIPMTEQLLQYQVLQFPPGAPPDEIPSSASLRAALQHALRHGADKHNNVYIYGPKDAGKSHVLKPMVVLFGQLCFVRPVGKKNSYPLQELFDKKVCVLQDFRATTYEMGFDDLLVWFEGESFQVPLPQNTHKGNKLYTERAPLFISAGSKLRISPKEALALQVAPEEQNDMMDARFKFFRHPAPVPPRHLRSVRPCPKCFATWLCSEWQ